MNVRHRAGVALLLTAATLSWLLPTACRTPVREVSAVPEDPFVWRRSLTRLQFERARLYKPREPAMTGLEFEYAPLIVEATDDSRIGGQRAEGSKGDGAVRPTIYTRRSSFVLKGSQYDQVTYLWSCPHLAPLYKKGNKAVRWIRTTIGHDGFPLLWEVFSDNEHGYGMFVAKSMEEAARSKFGSVLAGRQFVVETSLDANAHAVVVGVVEDGPIPMGPYFYVQGNHCAVTNILCRCSPSQVDEIIETVEYDLEPLDPDVRLPASANLPEKLRWPAGL